MAKSVVLAKISQKYEKNTVFEKNLSFLGKMVILAKISQKYEKNTVFEKNLSFLETHSY